MKLHFLPMTGALALVLSACATPAPSTAPVPVPGAPVVVPIPDTVAPPVAGPREAPKGWHLLDATVDGFPGISVLHAERELLAGRAPKRTVVVAVIDNGVDSAHADLRAHLWRNAKEQPNGRDDDGNGYADDSFGWNLIGGADGRNVNQDTYELTRLVAQCERGARARDSLPRRYQDRCPQLRAELDGKRADAEQTYEQLQQIDAVVKQVLPILRAAAGTDSLNVAVVTALEPKTFEQRQAKQVYLQLAANGLQPEEVSDVLAAYESQVQFGYNPEFDPRPIVGDGYPGTAVTRYGNPDATGPDAGHGTHVAGIIAAIRNGVGADGIATGVRIMSLRAVPDGDERDKDVANAIRYAVDNGAHVINMSFGKGHSPYKELVDAAVRYADSKGVLMVHAAGNEGADVQASPSYPTPVYLDGGRARHWIEVGATSWRGGDSLVATFSNYGTTLVDVFAPGEDIWSTVPGGYKRESGTSMASPVVAGLAALIMSHYPELTALEVKRVILESATKLGDRRVLRPGGGTARFGELSATGGIVNAYGALRMAAEIAAGK